MPDVPEQDSVSDPIRDALPSEVYRRAFGKVMAGTDVALLDEDERQALKAAREVTNTQGPGYPAPWGMDPTRRDAP